MAFRLEHINYRDTLKRRGDVSYLRVTDGTRQLRKDIEVNSRAFANASDIHHHHRGRRRVFVSRPRIIAALPRLYPREEERAPHATHRLTAVRK